MSFATSLRHLENFEHAQNVAIACGASAIPCERLVFRKPCGRCAQTMRLDDCDWTTATGRSHCDRKKNASGAPAFTAYTKLSRS